MPSLHNSPWIRGAPHSGFAAAIVSTSVRMVASVLGRPGRVRVERRVHRRRSHWRCHRTTVSGCTKIKAVRHSRHALASRIQKRRSRWAELRALDGARQGGQLLTKREVLKRDRPVSAADQSDRSEENDERRQHA